MQSQSRKSEQSAKLASDVAAWEAEGNVIHQVQVYENRWYKDKGNVRQAPLTVAAAQQQHRWRNARTGQ